MKYLFIATVVFLCSCSVTKKNKKYSKTTETSKIDSTAIKTLDSGTIKKDNSITITEKKDDYEKEIVIEFETETSKPKDTVGRVTRWVKNDFGPTADDYFPPGIKKITIKEKGVKTETKKEQANKVDSNFKKQSENVSVKKDEKKESVESTKSKTTKSYWWYLLLLLLIPIWYYRKKIGVFFGIIKKVI